MTDKMQTSKAKRLFFHIIEAVGITVFYGLFSYFVVYRLLADEVMLYAYLWNIGIIFTLLFIEKTTDVIVFSEDFLEFRKSAPGRVFTKIFYFLGYVSFRTELYLFYIFVLIGSRVSILEPALISNNVQRFLFSVEYCLIVLIVFDKFIEQLFKDDKRVRKITSRLLEAAERRKQKRKECIEKN